MNGSCMKFPTDKLPARPIELPNSENLPASEALEIESEEEFVLSRCIESPLHRSIREYLKNSK